MNRSKSGLFLMELIIAIAFFAVASAVCIQLFATAHSLRTRSFGLQMAVASAQSAADTFKVTGGDTYLMGELLGAQVSGGYLISWYDDEWNPATAEQARFVMLVVTDLEAVPAMAEIVITDRLLDLEIYRLNVLRYLGV